MLNYEYPPLGGGGGVATKILIEALAQRNIKVTLVTSSETNQPKEERPAKNISIFRLPVRGRSQRPVASLRSLFSYIRAVRKWSNTINPKDYDLVHSQFAVPTGLVGQQLAQRWHIPHVVTVHGFDIHDPTRNISADRFPPVHWAVQQVLSSADYITTQSRDIANRTRQGYHLKRDLSIIPLGIPKVAIPTGPKPAILPPGFILVGVGRMVKRKGFATAIQTLSLVSPKVELVLIGDGPELLSLQNLAKQLHLESRVHFLGAIHDQKKWEILAHSDVYILPSLHEGFSLSTVEAMMMGLPVIASSVGGQTDYLQPTSNALLVPPEEPRLWGAAIHELQTNHVLRSRMKQHNIQLANQLTDQAMADSYQKLYAHLLHQ